MNGFEVLGLFLLLSVLGVPLAVSMGLSAVTYIVISGMPLATVAHRMSNSINSFPLLAVVLFIYVGSLLNATGITPKLYDVIKALVGRVRGSLAYVNIFVNLVMAGISGAALADIGALGTIQIKAMKEQGYKAEFASAITAAAATVGPIFPPSIPLIIYAGIAEISGVKLLLSGVFPAFVIVLCQCVHVWYLARKHNFPVEAQRYTWKEKGRICVVGLPGLLTPVILVAGLLFGWFGPTELAAFAVFYSLFLGAFVYRKLTWKSLIQGARETVRATAIIMFIVSSAAIFAWVLTVEQLPDQLASILLGVTKNPLILLFMVNGILLIVGMFMETIAALMVMTPLIAPPLHAAGVDPIHLGLVVVFNLMIGLLTPPVGMSLYMVSIIADVPVARMAKVIWPFLVPLLVALLIVTVFPPIATWLPEYIFRR
jgi:tripartite ATP-independent transporter DctM subunit